MCVGAVGFGGKTFSQSVQNRSILMPGIVRRGSLLLSPSDNSWLYGVVLHVDRTVCYNIVSCPSMGVLAARPSVSAASSCPFMRNE